LAGKAGVSYDAAEQDKALIAWMREHGRAG
jgi:hypothetical protein